MIPKGIKTAILAALTIAALAVLVLLLANRNSSDPRPQPERPPLMLLTSLPLIFGERLSLEEGGSRALDALATRYNVVPIAAADPEQLRSAPLLLMAHANAQPAENLVALDQWVRDGGRLLLLADPTLEWHSERPLGDNLRPSPMFPDTGLLAHWGLRLQAPSERGPAARQLSGERILSVSPGRLTGACRIGADGFTAECRIGRGRVIVAADADFLDIDHLASADGDNLDALLATLGRLER